MARAFNIKCVLIAVLSFLLLPATTFKAQQQTTTSMEGVPPAGSLTLDLSGMWRVNTVAFLDDAMLSPDFDDHDWREVKVPARWSDQNIDAGDGTPLVAIYRRTFRVPTTWAGKPVGISAWLFPGHSMVTLNGTRLEAKGTAPWLYAEVTDLLKKDGNNLIAVSTQFDGVYELAFPNPPRVGPLDKWAMPAVQESAIALDMGGNPVKATLYAPPDGKPHPAVLMISTGSHGVAFTEPFIPLARELAYAGYTALPIGLPAQTPEYINQALDVLRKRPEVDPQRIAVIAGVSSATPVLEQTAAKQALAAVVVISTKDAPEAKGLNVPVLLIATTRDQTGPAVVYAKRVADSLAGPKQTLLLPGTQNGLGILDGHWNPVRQSILSWFDKYLATKASH